MNILKSAFVRVDVKDYAIDILGLTNTKMFYINDDKVLESIYDNKLRIEEVKDRELYKEIKVDHFVPITLEKAWLLMNGEYRDNLYFLKAHGHPKLYLGFKKYGLPYINTFNTLQFYTRGHVDIIR